MTEPEQRKPLLDPGRPIHEGRNVDGIDYNALHQCCAETVRELYGGLSKCIATEGQTMQCGYSDSPAHRAVFHDGWWEQDYAR